MHRYDKKICFNISGTPFSVKELKCPKKIQIEQKIVFQLLSLSRGCTAAWKICAVSPLCVCISGLQTETRGEGGCFGVSGVAKVTLM